jgi:hypothetical protein
MDWVPFFVAGRFWRFFRFAFALSAVINYIGNQENHHRRKSFQQEYLEFLERHKVPYDKRYIFKPVE